MNTLSLIFDWLLAASFRASLLVPVVLGLQWTMRRRIGARARYALWLPVLVVLIAPVLPQSQWSVENLLVREELPPVAASNALTPAATVKHEAPALQYAPQDEHRAGIEWTSVRLATWATGAAMLLLAASISFARTLRRYRMTSVPVNDEWLSEIAAAARDVSLSRAPLVWCSAEVPSPAVTGLWRPVLLLPASLATQFTAAEARLILRHELMHLKRRDLPLNALLCVLMALHWFNPLLWLAFWKVRADREAACDAQVLDNAPPQRRIEYGHALLKAESAFAPLRLSLGFVGLFQRGSMLRHRIQSIAIHQPAHPAMKLITLTCIATMTFFGITRAATTEEKPQVVLETKIIEITSRTSQPLDFEETLARVLAGLPKNRKDGRSPLASLTEFLKASQPADASKKPSLIAVLDDPQFQVVMRKLSQRKGVDLMSSPRLVAQDGQKATVEVSRSFGPLPGQKEQETGQNTGVTLEMLPEVRDSSALDLTLDPKIVEFDGFQDDARGAKKPVFNVRSSHARVSMESGQTALIDIGSRTDSQQVEDIDPSGKTEARTDRYTRRAVAFVTARVIKPKSGKPAPKGFSIGKFAFRQGDRIAITNVQRGNGFLTVTADYELASTAGASLSLYITSLTSTAPVKTDATQRISVTKGKGTVTLHHPDLPEGLPHLSFYDSKTRKAIGGIYFGTEAEAKRSMAMNLDYMLEGRPATAVKSTPEATQEAEAGKLRAARAQRYDFSKASLGDVLRFLATDAGLNFIALNENDPLNRRLITFGLESSPFEVLEKICRANGLSLILDRGTWHIRPRNDDALSARVYPNPDAKNVPAEVVLKDLRRILGISGTTETPAAENNAREKPGVTFKEGDNSFHIVATAMQHQWVDGYLTALARGK